MAQAPVKPVPRKGRLKQSVSRWCFAKIPMEDFCREVVRLGLVGIDLLGPADWPVVQKFCSFRRWARPAEAEKPGR